MIFILYAALAAIGAVLHSMMRKTPLQETLLVYILVICVGVSGVLGFYGHTFRASLEAHYIGWAPGSPFQFEVACANLGMGICAILCIWFRRDFRLATVIAYSVFALGAAYGHIVEITRNHDYAPGNAGPVLYYDMLVPAALIVLTVISWRKSGHGVSPRQ
jgi:hypothetical protein